MLSIFLILFFITGCGLGLFIFRNPKAALELQRRFYAKINWRIEPIDLSKEIRNTRLMGAFLMAISFSGMLVFFLSVLFP